LKQTGFNVWNIILVRTLILLNGSLCLAFTASERQFQFSRTK